MANSGLLRHAPRFNRLSNMAAMSNAVRALSSASMTIEANSAEIVVVTPKNKLRDKQTARLRDRRIAKKTPR